MKEQTKKERKNGKINEDENKGQKERRKGEPKNEREGKEKR